MNIVAIIVLIAVVVVWAYLDGKMRWDRMRSQSREDQRQGGLDQPNPRGDLR